MYLWLSINHVHVLRSAVLAHVAAAVPAKQPRVRPRACYSVRFRHNTPTKSCCSLEHYHCFIELSHQEAGTCDGRVMRMHQWWRPSPFSKAVKPLSCASILGFCSSSSQEDALPLPLPSARLRLLSSFLVSISSCTVFASAQTRASSLKIARQLRLLSTQIVYVAAAHCTLHACSTHQTATKSLHPHMTSPARHAESEQALALMRPLSSAAASRISFLTFSAQSMRRVSSTRRGSRSSASSHRWHSRLRCNPASNTSQPRSPNKPAHRQPQSAFWSSGIGIKRPWCQNLSMQHFSHSLSMGSLMLLSSNQQAAGSLA